MGGGGYIHTYLASFEGVGGVYNSIGIKCSYWQYLVGISLLAQLVAGLDTQDEGLWFEFLQDYMCVCVCGGGGGYVCVWYVCVWVCVCVMVYVFMGRVCVCGICVYVCVWVWVCAFACMCVCWGGGGRVYVCVCVGGYACMCICVWAYMWVCRLNFECFSLSTERESVYSPVVISLNLFLSENGLSVSSGQLWSYDLCVSMLINSS